MRPDLLPLDPEQAFKVDRVTEAYLFDHWLAGKQHVFAGVLFPAGTWGMRGLISRLRFGE